MVRGAIIVTLGVGAAACGVGMLLVLAQHDTTMAFVGVALVLAGAVPVVFSRRERRRQLAAIYTIVVLATIAAWAIARYGTKPEYGPQAPPELADGVAAFTTPAEAWAKGLQAARDASARLATIDGYTFSTTKRERAKNLFGDMHLVDSKLFVKIRREPFSVYALYVEPEAKKGTEAIYMKGRDGGKMIVHSTVKPASLMGTMKLEPTDWRAMVDQRYPITYAGMASMAAALPKLEKDHAQAIKQCDVRWIVNQQVDGRPCVGVEIRNDHARGELDLAHGLYLFDQEWNVPTRMQRWDYIEVDGARTKLLVADYTITQLRFDVALTDEDFDPDNPEYGY